jgi:hypothetical protein
MWHQSRSLRKEALAVLHLCLVGPAWAVVVEWVVEWVWAAVAAWVVVVEWVVVAEWAVAVAEVWVVVE